MRPNASSPAGLISFDHVNKQRHWALDRLGHPKRCDSNKPNSVSQAWSPYLRNGFHTLQCDELGDVQVCLQVKNSTRLSHSYCVLFYLGEKQHTTNSMVFSTDLAAPAHSVQIWPNVSPTTTRTKKPNLSPKNQCCGSFPVLGRNVCVE